MPEERTRRPYGLWDSPITPERLARVGGFTDLAWDRSGALLWRETRAGKGLLVLQATADDAPRDLNDKYSTRGRVGYGGGEFTVGRGIAYFVEAQSGRLYRQALAGGEPRPVTPAFGGAAAPVLSPDGRWLVYVHTDGGQDCLALVDASGETWPVKLVSGDDFYMQPAWHPDGNRLAWIAWNHPNMPWDGTQLYLAGLEFYAGQFAHLGELSQVAGGEQISVMQPVFSPDGRYLAYISDESGWWQIYLYDLATSERRQLTEAPAEHGQPAWVQGLRSYDFSPDGAHLYYLRNEQGFASLWQADLATRQHTRLPVGEEYTWLEQVAAGPDGRRLALIASATHISPRVLVISLDGAPRVVRRSTAEDLPAAFYAQPEAVRWKGGDGEQVYGLYYAPQHPHFEGIGLPPLIVHIHGGPTGQRTASFDPETQFFTSRGYAVLQVNFRGSSGYGRAYRNRLRGEWGICDVEDAVSGATFLADQGRVDPSRLAIMGGSSGGFTVLKALEDYPGFFSAGVNLYGVANHYDMLFDTHKFEARYNDTLLGPFPEATELYRQRSPIFFLDKIQDPLAVFHGAEDRVVSPGQSAEVAAALRRRGVPHIYHVYEGEGHGFNKPETIAHVYTAIERFLRQYVIAG